VLLAYRPGKSASESCSRKALKVSFERGLDRILSVGDLGELTSEQLADFILEHLTEYYLAHRPR
jgi:hypothetical protein